MAKWPDCELRQRANYFRMLPCGTTPSCRGSVDAASLGRAQLDRGYRVDSAWMVDVATESGADVMSAHMTYARGSPDGRNKTRKFNTFLGVAAWQARPEQLSYATPHL